MPSLTVTTNNLFHLGWVLYILGQPRPARRDDVAGPDVTVADEKLDWGDIGGDGWDMASESGAFLRGLHAICAKMTGLGQLAVAVREKP